MSVEEICGRCDPYTLLTCSSCGTLCTYGAVRVALNLNARPAVGAGAGCAVVLRPQESVAVESLGAPLAVVPRRVVLALALARLRVADVRVIVAAARDAPGEGAAVVLVVVTGLAQLAELALVSLRALATFDPGILYHSVVTISKLGRNYIIF